MIWLPIGLLAAWCVGRPYKVGPATLVAAAIVFDAGVMIETQPGEGRNDIMGLAFLLAFAAFLINGHQRRAPSSGAVPDMPERDAPLLDKGPLIMAGIAAGLATSVKPTLLVAGRRDHGRRHPLQRPGPALDHRLGDGRCRCSSSAATGTCGRRSTRAATRSRITKFGPLNLPKPDQMPLDPRPRFAVADYLTEPTIYRKWFFPELDNALGPLWPLILIVAVAAACLHRRRRATRSSA